MDQISTAIGLSNLNERQPMSLAAWNEQYEALSFEHDGWFRAGAAGLRLIRSAIARASRLIYKVALHAPTVEGARSLSGRAAR